MTSPRELRVSVNGGTLPKRPIAIDAIFIDLESSQSCPGNYSLELHVSGYEWATVLFTILFSALRVSMECFRPTCIYLFRGITGGYEAIPQYLGVR